MRLFSFYSIQLSLWLLSVGASIVSLWTLLSRVSAQYWYYTNYGLRFVWDSSAFIQYSYYRDFFCLGSASRLRNHHQHVWVRYIDNNKITVACMSSLLLYIDLRWLCYFILFYFKLTNGAMVKRWMVKCYNGEINIRIGHFVSHKYLICSFVLFLNTKFP